LGCKSEEERKKERRKEGKKERKKERNTYANDQFYLVIFFCFIWLLLKCKSTNIKRANFYKKSCTPLKLFCTFG